jgi:4-diphosphocytidyl-2-C-methyl-D-erythritol kinase
MAAPGAAHGATLREAAPAKINLFLHVLSRRADGYHLLDSLVVFAGAADFLGAEPADSFSLALRGPFGDALAHGGASEDDNLVLRAGRALAEAAGIVPAARVTLEKNLPIAAGIGGGSADAAAALCLLSRLWHLDLPPEKISSVALQLGADVPVCLAGKPARMGGVGEILRPAPTLPECGLLLVNPGVAVATPAVFRARAGAFSAPAILPAAWPDAAAMAADLAFLKNDLQIPAIGLCPVIAEVLDAIGRTEDCLLARMSGSGATCFGLFADRAAAERAATRSGGRDWWVWGGALTRA